jgi:hypothetical protein
VIIKYSYKKFAKIFYGRLLFIASMYKQINIKSMKKALLVFSLAVSISACSHKAFEESSPQDKTMGASAPVGGAELKKDSNSDILSINSPKLIKQAEIRMEVLDLKLQTESIKQVANAYKGYISSMNFTNNYATSENTLIIKIPSDNFDKVIDEISKQAKYIESKNIAIQDVSEEYVDVEARIKTKLEVEQRYLDILRTKSKTVKDVLDAEEQLRIIREEIEAKQARLNLLKNQVAYSTLHLTLYQRIEVSNAPEANEASFLYKLKNAFQGGWDVIVWLFLAILYIWPIWIILFISVYFFRKRRAFKKKTS